MPQPNDEHTIDPIFSFWGIGDMHYRAIVSWHNFHTMRLASMFDDLHTLWKAEGTPAFCVSPGDLVETCAQENYVLAKSALMAQLADIPFYPGVGNHEYQDSIGKNTVSIPELFHATWGKPIRYSWEVGEFACIMLDYPDPATLEDPDHYISISLETLSFLDAKLAEYKDRPAIIFLHCPLRNTVLDRGGIKSRDYSSAESFFSPENSDAVRDILALRGNGCLFISGHTHSGWEAPNLVVTEELGGHPVIFVNLMSPWYTGRGKGPHLSDDLKSLQYVPDDPNVVISFSFRLYHDQASIRIREHTSQQWLKEWIVPLHAS